MEKELVKIEGVVDSMIYKNDESGYAVARAVLSDESETTIVGNMPFLGVGEHIVAQGNYVTHAQHGAQFSVVTYERTMPADVAGIYDYLASRVVKGVGPKTAAAIVAAFGVDTFNVMAYDPGKLSSIKGITAAKAREIGDGFLKLNTMRLLVEHLSNAGLPIYFAAALFKLYGDGALTFLKNDPYILCDERFGISFHQADAIADNSGIAKDSDIRLDAALLYELTYNLQNGHAFIPEDKLLAATAQLCDSNGEMLQKRLFELCKKGKIVPDIAGEAQVYYLAHIYECECFLAEEVRRMKDLRLVVPKNLDKLIEAQQSQAGMVYAEKQKEAMKLCFGSAICVITGGPGTGKTTTLLSMIALLEANGLKSLLAAPTGRAAKRMSELSGREAKTLHRLLEAYYDNEKAMMCFKRSASNLLDTDVIIVDEASMLDLSLASALLRAMKPHTRLVLVGDNDQLPPMGPGSFFADLIASDCVSKVCLDYIFRQAQDSDIVMNAHKINSGEMPDLKKNAGDFYFTAARSAESAVNTVKGLITTRIPGYFGIDAADIQVICPTRQMACGTVALNKALQDSLNPASALKAEVRFGAAVFRVGDRVMQIRNNYDLLWRKLDNPEVGTGVFNGDTGVITLIDKAAKILTVRFDDREADYVFDDVKELEHAYAITAHKSQGSEYGAVIMPIFQSPQRLLNRKLLYTAVTRAKKLLVIVGREELLRTMVSEGRKNRRYSALKRRIKELCQDETAD